MRHDIDRTDYYDSYGGNRHDDDKISAVFIVSGGKTYTEVHTVSREGTAFGGVWAACYLLFERCNYFEWRSRAAGTDCDTICDCTALLEKADALVDCGRNRLLYAARAVFVLRYGYRKEIFDCKNLRTMMMGDLWDSICGIIRTGSEEMEKASWS